MNKKSGTIEERKHERIPAKIMLDIFTPDGMTNLGRGFIVDISLGGIGVEADMNVSLDTDICMFVILAPLHFTIQGLVVYKKQEMSNLFRYGVKYTKMNFFDKLKLRRYIMKYIKSHKNNK